VTYSSLSQMDLVGGPQDSHAKGPRLATVVQLPAGVVRLRFTVVMDVSLNTGLVAAPLLRRQLAQLLVGPCHQTGPAAEPWDIHVLDQRLEIAAQTTDGAVLTLLIVERAVTQRTVRVWVARLRLPLPSKNHHQ
jgi:hypothetical protein